jgi:hypothetical protein
MDKVKYAMMALSAVATVLCFVEGVISAGAHGWILVGACAIPAALGGLSIASGKGLGRGQAIGRLVAFLIAGMKSSGGLDSIMVTAFFGMLVALVLAIKPERKRAA